MPRRRVFKVGGGGRIAKDSRGRTWSRYSKKRYARKCTVCDALVHDGWISVLTSEFICDNHVDLKREVCNIQQGE